MLTTDAILATLLRAGPNWMSTKDVAQAMNASPRNVGSRLSKLTYYGQIERDYSHQDNPRPGHLRNRIALYRAKDAERAISTPDRTT